MLGDFNITEDPIDRAPHRPDDLVAMAALRDLRIAWNLQDTWRLLNPNTCAYTYRALCKAADTIGRLTVNIACAQAQYTNTHSYVHAIPVHPDQVGLPYCLTSELVKRAQQYVKRAARGVTHEGHLASSYRDSLTE
jgi:hypothetical protein